MDSRLKRCWTLIFQASAKMRDFGHSFSGQDLEKLTLAQARVLEVVFQCSPQGVMLKDIARRVKLTPGAVSQTIDVLVKMDLVERNSDPNDRRAVNIHIAKRGMEIRNEVSSTLDKTMEAVLSKKSPKERAAFVSILEQFIEHFANTQQSGRRLVAESLLVMEDTQ